MDKKKAIRYLCLVAVTFGIVCSKGPALSGTEVTNGNCIGKIYNPDGSAAADAVVKLIPADYNPYTQTGEFIDSTDTDENGDYGFMVSQPNYYNVVAEKGSASCMQHSIYVETNAKIVVDNDTLRESGTLSGVVRLKPGDDNRQVVILVLGTNVYAVPSDTSGNFETPLLPEGIYTIQIFTTLDGYAVFDTNATIREGTRTQLDVTLPSGNAPLVEQLSATYDSATMFVSLAWPMSDTSAIVSYALYRKGTTGRDTMVLIDKSATFYTDDVVGFDGDSVSYEIAGIGKNYKEGFRAVTKPIIVCGLVHCVKKFDMSRIVAGLDFDYGDVFVDQEGQILLVGQYGIYTLDTNGVVRKDHRLDDNDQSEYWISSMQSDDRGHLYIRKDRSDDTQLVVKFDADLNVIAQMPLDSGCRSFAAGRNGTIYAFYNVTDSVKGACTAIKEYDSSFTLTKESRIVNRISSGYNPTRFGDTMVTLEYQPTDGHQRFHFYDTAFTLLSVVVPVDSCTNGQCNPRFDSRVRYDGFIAAPNGIFISCIGGCGSRLLLFTDRNGEFLARIVVPEHYRFSFDSRGNLYFVTYKFSVCDDMDPYNQVKTLFKYSMEPLLRKIGR